MDNVTFKPKCYTFVCIGCNLLAQSERSDAITCCTACRVRAHRNGRAKKIKQIAKNIGCIAGKLQQFEAVMRLAPELWPDIKSDSKTLNEVMPEINSRGMKLLFEQIERDG